MAQDTMIEAAVTGGLDVSDRYTYVCVLNFSGGGVDEGRGPTTPEALRRRVSGHGPMRLVVGDGAPFPPVSPPLLGGGAAGPGGKPGRARVLRRRGANKERAR